MLDTSYGFNNLLKEVCSHSFRDINTSPVSKKLSSKTSMPAKRSAPKLKDLSDPSVSSQYQQKIQCYLLSVLSSLEALERQAESFAIFKSF